MVPKASSALDIENNVNLPGQSKIDCFFSVVPDTSVSPGGTAETDYGSSPQDCLLHTGPATDNYLALGPQSVQTRIDDQVAVEDSNLTFGSALISPNKKETFRVYFQNANSIWSERMEKWLDACVTMRGKDVDLFGLAEINVNPRHPGLSEQVSQIAKRNWSHANTILTNTDTDCRAWAQQGGTSITTTRKWTSRLVERGCDSKLGRWCYHVLRGRQNQKTVFISGYQVCQSNVAGPLTAASQQWSILKQSGISNPNPRNQFFTDLATQIKQWLGKNGKSVSCLMPMRLMRIPNKVSQNF